MSVALNFKRRAYKPSFMRNKFLHAGLIVILLFAAGNLCLYQKPNHTILSDISDAEETKKLDFVAVLGDKLYTSRDFGFKE